MYAKYRQLKLNIILNTKWGHSSVTTCKPHPPSLKRADLFIQKNCTMFWNEWKINFTTFSFLRYGRSNFLESSNFFSVPKDAQRFRNGFYTKFDNLAIYSFWDIVNFVLNIRSALVWDLTNLVRLKIS